MENVELIHSGIKGMRWGIRRYQNKDGSLTPAGKKRYNAEMAKLRAEEKTIKNKLAAKSKLQKIEDKKKSVDDLKKQLDDVDSKKKPTKKSVKEMSDEELNERIARLELEKKYLDAVKNTKTSNDRGSKFVEKFLDSTVEKVADNSTADVVAQAIKVLVTKGVNNAFGDEVVYTNNKKK